MKIIGIFNVIIYTKNIHASMNKNIGIYNVIKYNKTIYPLNKNYWYI